MILGGMLLQGGDLGLEGVDMIGEARAGVDIVRGERIRGGKGLHLGEGDLQVIIRRGSLSK